MSRYPKQMLWLPDDRIAFAGDSITDAGRFDDPDGLGQGYVRKIAETLTARYPRLRLDIVNRGVGGNTVRDLHARWTRDVLEEKAPWIVIMIGINDVWHRLTSPDHTGGVALDDYEVYYQGIVDAARANGSKLVLCETTVIEEDPESVGNHVLAAYNDVIRRLAAATNETVLVPMHEAFLKAIRWRPELNWTTDGVHPTGIGHALIAETILSTVGA